MARNFTDTRTLIAALDMLEDDVMDAIGRAVTDGINNMELDVKANAPKSGDVTPNIHGGGKVVDYNISSFTYKTFANRNANAEFGITGDAADLAAFIEFGTGTDAAGYVPSLETDFQRQAMQFYKNGKGSLANMSS